MSEKAEREATLHWAAARIAVWAFVNECEDMVEDVVNIVCRKAKLSYSDIDILREKTLLAVSSRKVA